MEGTSPEKVGLSDQHDTLLLSYADGRSELIAAARLRLACRCAPCTRARIDGMFPQSFDAITICTVSAVGEYGINIGFSDGHARGIYPWAYLATLIEN
jgi:prepilin-type processing-associated H-X9-DG protein